jgi:hypothetical protein
MKEVPVFRIDCEGTPVGQSGWVSLGQFLPAKSGIGLESPASVLRESGTDAQISLASRHLDCCGFIPRLTLDQESPGSSPGGATRRSDAASVVSGLFASAPAAPVSATAPSAGSSGPLESRAGRSRVEPCVPLTSVAEVEKPPPAGRLPRGGWKVVSPGAVGSPLTTAARALGGSVVGTDHGSDAGWARGLRRLSFPSPPSELGDARSPPLHRSGIADGAAGCRNSGATSPPGAGPRRACRGVTRAAVHPRGPG